MAISDICFRTFLMGRHLFVFDRMFLNTIHQRISFCVLWFGWFPMYNHVKQQKWKIDSLLLLSISFVILPVDHNLLCVSLKSQNWCFEGKFLSFAHFWSAYRTKPIRNESHQDKRSIRKKNTLAKISVRKIRFLPDGLLQFFYTPLGIWPNDTGLQLKWS